MGSDVYYENEKPAHRVYLELFWIDSTEVTNIMFAHFLNKNSNQTSKGVKWLDIDDLDAKIQYNNNEWVVIDGYENHPVVEISWYGAEAYCSWVDRRLPTEAEWEKAARGSSGNIYPWGNTAPNGTLLNYNNNLGDTTEVGKYPAGASIYGALDMAGNVQEWVSDFFDAGYYYISPLSNPLGPDTGWLHIVRGGAWGDDDNGVRSSYRTTNLPSVEYNYIGFRCAMDAD